MPDVTIEIGARPFTVSCAEGEEPILSAAAKLLDNEAQRLGQAAARLTDSRLLLMAGLMLADRSMSAEEELRKMDARLAEAESRPAPEPVEVVREVPVETVVEREVEREVVPADALARVEALAERAEALAAAAADRAEG